MTQEKFDYHIEQTNTRLEKIEEKLDQLIEAKGNHNGQLSLLVMFISALVSSAVSYLVKNKN